jgi:hypothetical protein
VVRLLSGPSHDVTVRERRSKIPTVTDHTGHTITVQEGQYNYIVNVKQSHYTQLKCRRERRYSSYSFITSALDGGEWSASRPGRALTPGKGPPVPIGQEAGWAPEPVWTQRLEAKSFVPSGIEPRSPGLPTRCQTLY